jgi:hypothetical protein
MQVKALRTIEVQSFQESLRDRLAGALGRQGPFRMATDSKGRILETEPFLSAVEIVDPNEGKSWRIRGDHTPRMVFPTYIAVDADDNI